MGNPNSGKGAASRLEDLMNYQKNKKPKIKCESPIEKHCETENTFCKLPDITANKQEMPESEELDDPSLQDFIDVIEDSDVLQDKDLSLQLLFLMQYFLKMRMNTNNE